MLGPKNDRAAQAIGLRLEAGDSIERSLDPGGVIAGRRAERLGCPHSRQTYPATPVAGMREVHDAITARIGPVMKAWVAAKRNPWGGTMLRQHGDAYEIELSTTELNVARQPPVPKFTFKATWN